MKTIEMTVNPRGEATVRTLGFSGGECREASRFVEQALGRPARETLTAEYHEGERARQDHRQSR